MEGGVGGQAATAEGQGATAGRMGGNIGSVEEVAAGGVTTGMEGSIGSASSVGGRGRRLDAVG